MPCHVYQILVKSTVSRCDTCGEVPATIHLNEASLCDTCFIDTLFFDPVRYPGLRKVTHSDRHGRMELLSVNITSDGFLVGWARIGEGADAHEHSVFVGLASDYTKRKPNND